MRRLTLILSDLFLPAEAGAEELAPRAADSDTVALPNLAWLLRFASERRRVGDWRGRVASMAGLGSAGAPAQLVARDRIPKASGAATWFATPVHLEARLDHVRLARQGLLRLDAEQRDACREEFARSFGPELALHDDGARGFLLTGLDAGDVETADPARLLGADIESALPRGPHSSALRKLTSEIEMWLHGATLNRDRARARLAPVSSLWIWGGGGAAAPVGVARRDDVSYAGEDSWLGAVARLQTGSSPLAAPSNFVQMPRGASHGIVELTPMSVDDGLATLDTDWLAPAREALTRGELQQLDLLANDRQFTLRRHDGWRFWRRRRHWLELLRLPGEAHAA